MPPEMDKILQLTFPDWTEDLAHHKQGKSKKAKVKPDILQAFITKFFTFPLIINIDLVRLNFRYITKNRVVIDFYFKRMTL